MATAAAGTVAGAATGDEDGVEGRSLTASEFLSSKSGFMWLPRFLFCFLLRVVMRVRRASAIAAVLSHGRQTDNKGDDAVRQEMQIFQYPYAL
ncbi:hypothetical protein [Burkholderia sp. Ax-1735]|uniref:hypothetical protein n=1 Tax=Burkholderia sp. Ax-1735 TaxID=2608329 RepID=UPI0014210DB4|nr:hypothetical protein [Burkholderia sp. Ax-1735]